MCEIHYEGRGSENRKTLALTAITTMVKVEGQQLIKKSKKSPNNITLPLS